MSTFTITRKEIVGYMMEEAAAMFGCHGEAVIDLDTHAITATPFGEEPVTVTAKQFSVGLTKWAEENKNSGYGFHRRAARNALQPDWARFDYDATISSAILESLVGC